MDSNKWAATFDEHPAPASRVLRSPEWIATNVEDVAAAEFDWRLGFFGALSG